MGNFWTLVLSFPLCLQTVTSAPSNEEIESLKSLVSVLTESVLQLQEEVEELKNTNGGGSTTNNNGDIRLGTNYVRWGRTSCPDTARLIYAGYTAKSHYTHSGGGANYICLDKNPKWPDVTNGEFQSKGYIYGVEYQTLTGLNGSLSNNDAPCAVCLVEGRVQQLMIPGNRTCPGDWTKEYEGVLVSAHYNHNKATYACLDSSPEVIAGGRSSVDGGLFYTVEAVCGSLPCPPYVSGYEIACVVCTY